MFPEAKTLTARHPPSPGITRKSRSHPAPQRSLKSAGLGGTNLCLSCNFQALNSLKPTALRKHYHFHPGKASSREKTSFTLGSVIALLRLRATGLRPSGQRGCHSHPPPAPRRDVHFRFLWASGRTEGRRGAGSGSPSCASRQDFALPILGFHQ